MRMRLLISLCLCVSRAAASRATSASRSLLHGMAATTTDAALVSMASVGASVELDVSTSAVQPLEALPGEADAGSAIESAKRCKLSPPTAAVEQESPHAALATDAEGFQDTVASSAAAVNGGRVATETEASNPARSADAANCVLAGHKDGATATLAPAAAAEPATDGSSDGREAADAAGAAAPPAADAALARSFIPVIAFFHGGEDPLGRTFAEMLAYSFDRMEECHDYVQWVWPLHEPSMFASVFPVLDEEQAAVLAGSPTAQAHARAALAKFYAFWGLPATPGGPYDAASNRLRWCRDGDHNLLRVTRVIRSLRLMGLEAEAAAFAETARAVGAKRGLSRRTLTYWRRAAEEPCFAPLR